MSTGSTCSTCSTRPCTCSSRPRCASLTFCSSSCSSHASTRPTSSCPAKWCASSAGWATATRHRSLQVTFKTTDETKITSLFLSLHPTPFTFSHTRTHIDKKTTHVYSKSLTFTRFFQFCFFFLIETLMTNISATLSFFFFLVYLYFKNFIFDFYLIIIFASTRVLFRHSWIFGCY